MKKYLLALGAFVGVFLVSNSASAVVLPSAQLPEEIRIAANDSWTVSVQSTNILRLAARIDYDKPAGGNYPLEISVNDQPLTASLLNKGASFTYKDGRNFSYQSGNAWMLFYSQNFSANNSSAGGGYQVVTDPGQAYLYKWDISSLVGGASSMKLVIKNNGNSVGKPIVIRILSKYPIAELGNCGDENACKTYCSKQENYAACTDYGSKNNIISPEDAAKAKEFADVLKGEGPGGCKDEASCRTYCDGTAHLSECITFAEKHNFVKGDQLAEAKKVIKALESGAKLPGGCTNKDSCEAYCKVSTHAEECLSFAKTAGFISAEDAADAEKVLPLIKSGETPGGCTTKADCKKYCDDSSHNTECVNFAVKAGFMSKEDADMALKTGGVGPGGCKSKDSCEKYCNNKDNQKECFAFAQKYNLIPADKLKEMQDGMGRLRSGLDQMPAEAIACLKDKLGQDIVGEIQSGNFAPGPETGDIIKGCFDKVLPQLQAKLQQGLSQATPAATQCLQSNLGAGELDKIKSGEAPSPESGDVLKKCFESMKTEGLQKLKSGLDKMPPEIKTCITDKLGADTVQKIQSGATVDLGADTGTAIQDCVKAGQGALQQKMQEGLKNAPAAIQDCIKSKLGDVGAKMQSGKLQGEGDVQKIIQECASNLKPQGIPSGANIPGGMPTDTESLKKLQEKYKEMKPGEIPKGIQAPPAGLMPNNVSKPQEGSEIPSGTLTPPSGFGPNTGGPVAAPGTGATSAVPPAGLTPTPEICAQFASVPSCSYVPGAAQEICKKCKTE